MSSARSRGARTIVSKTPPREAQPLIERAAAMLALVFSAPSAAMARKLQSAETTSYDDVVEDLCKEGTGTRTELTLTQTEVMKVTVSRGTGSPSKVWVTNEDGTILAIKDSMVNIDLDELWGNPSELTAHAHTHGHAYTHGHADGHGHEHGHAHAHTRWHTNAHVHAHAHARAYVLRSSA